MGRTVRFSVSIDSDLLRRFDEAIKRKYYGSRSKAVRDLIRNFLVEREWEESDREVMGSLTILYDHHVKGVVDKLLEIQHMRRDNIISTMHVHLDEDNCMEVMALKGFPNEIMEISNQIVSCKGVKHGKLVMSSTGKEIT